MRCQWDLPTGALATPVVVQDERRELVPAPEWPAPSTDRSFWLTSTGLVEDEPSGATITYRGTSLLGTTVTLESDPFQEDLRISGEAYVDLSHVLPQGGDTTFAYWLQVFDNGEPWPTTAEAFRMARSETARADEETARVDRERQRAERLRQAGIDADS